MGLDFGTPNPDPALVVEPVITAGPLGAPVRVASYSEQLLLVSDYSSGTIFYVGKSDPAQIREGFQINGRALAVGHFRGDIIVGNVTSGSVEVYTRRGKLKYTLNGQDTIERPSDLAVDRDQEKIFMVDGRGHEVKVYQAGSSRMMHGRSRTVSADRGGELLDRFGADVLINPVGIAIDPSSELVYVSDHGDSMTNISAAIFVFTYDGVMVDQLDSAACGFYRPRGLAFDSGRLYITDALAGEIIVVDVDTKIKVGVVGEYGSDPGQLVQPQDVAVDPGGVFVYVANKRLGRIEKIAAEGDLQ